MELVDQIAAGPAQEQQALDPEPMIRVTIDRP
jgi:hypothetical protein